MASTRSFNILAEEARAGGVVTPDGDNLNNPSAHIVLNIKSLSPGQSLTVQLLGVSASGGEYIVFQSIPATVAAVHRYVVGTTFECVPGISCRDFIPKRYRLRVVPELPGQTDTYALDVELGL